MVVMLDLSPSHCSKRAQTLVEFLLVLLLVAIVLIVALRSTGGKLSPPLEQTANSLENVQPE